MTVSPLDEWAFLVGNWRGEVEDQFGEKGVVVSTATFTREPGEKFLMATGESTCEGRLIHRYLAFLYWDPIGGKFRRKSVYSYGFVNNEVEYERRPGEIRFDIVMEPSPRAFEGLRWRSHIRKIDDALIAEGLQNAKPDEPFKSYGEVEMRKQSATPQSQNRAA